jgi:hypothetical protein
MMMPFLGALAKFREATINFINVSPSVLQSFRSHGTIRLSFDGFSTEHLTVFKKSVEKIQV